MLHDGEKKAVQAPLAVNKRSHSVLAFWKGDSHRHSGGEQGSGLQQLWSTGEISFIRLSL